MEMLHLFMKIFFVVDVLRLHIVNQFKSDSFNSISKVTFDQEEYTRHRSTNILEKIKYLSSNKGLFTNDVMR